MVSARVVLGLAVCCLFLTGLCCFYFHECCIGTRCSPQPYVVSYCIQLECELVELLCYTVNSSSGVLGMLRAGLVFWLPVARWVQWTRAAWGLLGRVAVVGKWGSGAVAIGVACAGWSLDITPVAVGAAIILVWHPVPVSGGCCWPWVVSADSVLGRHHSCWEWPVRLEVRFYVFLLQGCIYGIL